MFPAVPLACWEGKTITLDDLSRRFASRPADTPETRHIRGTALAVAQDWLIRIPDSSEKDAAIGHLDAAAVWACEAYSRNPRRS